MKLNTEEFFQTIFNEACFLETKKKTTEEFITQAKQIHSEYDYSKVNYVNSKEKVIIGCPKHGEFSAWPGDLVRGVGCPKCGRELTRNKKTLNNVEFIERAKQIFPNYDYSKVNYVNCRGKVIIGCHKHGEFIIQPSNLLNGHGCPKCGRELVTKKLSSSTEEFIAKAKQIHPEYDYSKVNYVNASEKVIIGCPKHGEFLIRPSSLLSGKGCLKCGNEKVIKSLSSSTEEFIAQAKQIRPEYDYSKVNYVNSKEKVIIGCPKHGEFLMTPSSLLSGQGCPKCGRELVAKKLSSSTEEFIEKAKQIHPEYDYSKVNYVNCKEKVIIGCPKHGEFLTSPSDFLQGCGCPRCSESKGEQVIRTWLENQKINFSDQHRFYDLKSYPYDFYLPEYNLVIEYNGIQHYEVKDFFHRKNGDFEGQLMRDHIKKDYAEKNGYDLLVIPYWEFKNIDKILSEKLA